MSSDQPFSSTQGDGATLVPRRSYLVCATPRSGSTLLCQSLERTGVAGRPREYFEALKETGVPRRPREYFWGLRSPEVFRLLPSESELDRRSEQAPTWNRDDYARHLEASLREGTTPDGVFGAKLMWSYFGGWSGRREAPGVARRGRLSPTRPTSYFGDFMELMRGIPRFGGMGDGSLLNAAFPGVRFVFISRSDKVRQAVRCGAPCRPGSGAMSAGALMARPPPIIARCIRLTRSSICSISCAVTRTPGGAFSSASASDRCRCCTRTSPETSRAR